MRFTSEQVEEYIARRAEAARSRVGPITIIQKQEADHGPAETTGPIVARESEVDNRAIRPGLDETRHPKFRVSITFRVSDRRRRDNSGMLDTILDCLISAGRLLGNVGNWKRKNDPRFKR